MCGCGGRCVCLLHVCDVWICVFLIGLRSAVNSRQVTRKGRCDVTGKSDEKEDLVR